VANIIADAIISLAGIIKPLLKEEGFFISSGIINDRKNDVLAAFESEGYRILEVKEKGEWVAVVTTIK
jgi:ribosomal protein L11 methyltransferase